MAPTWALPLVAAVALLVPLVVERVHEPTRLFVSRVALGLFGPYVATGSSRKAEQRRRLRAAHVAETHRVYASRTLLYGFVLGLAGSVFGVYLAAAGLRGLAVEGEAFREALPGALSFLAGLTRLTDLAIGELFTLLLFSSATVGAVLALGTYLARWELLEQRAHARATEIEATLPRTIAFIYALSRSGMAFPQVLETLADNKAVYGEAAAEVGVAVRDMNAFGTDVITALQRMAERTPSNGMEEFADNLASVLGSGRSLSAFLRDQYERYQEEAEAQQEQYLDLLSTFAEAYVTVLVAGPLFFITILVVIGLVLEDTLTLLRIVTYGGIPLASLAFMGYVDSITQSYGGVTTGGRSRTEAQSWRVIAAVEGDSGDPGTGTGDGDPGTGTGDGDPGTGTGADDLAAGTVVAEGSSVAGGGNPPDGGNLPDGGNVADGASVADGESFTGAWERPSQPDPWLVSRERLAAYERFERVRGWLRDPVTTVRRNPHVTFALTVPLGLVWMYIRAGAVPGSALEAVRALDGPFVEAMLFVLGAYALVHEADKRHIRALEAAVPDFLDRLASVNEAGMSVVESLERLTRSDLEALTDEVTRTWRDVLWGAEVQTALRRMDHRVGSAMVSRAVTLVANSMEASGDIAPVLKIAADEARASRRLRRERRQEMFTYLLVIYLSFLVFIGIIVALRFSFIPAIESADLASASQSGEVTGLAQSPFAGIGQVDTGAYTLIFYHAAVIQAVLSGLIAGQLGEGSLRDGAKHAVVLLAFTVVAFALM